MSRWSFGGASFAHAENSRRGSYGYGPICNHKVTRTIERCIELNINSWDFAPIYGFGFAEERMGEFLKSRPSSRENFFIQSKGGISWHKDGPFKGRIHRSNSPEHIYSNLIASIERLQSSYIDLYYIHWPDPQVDIRKSLDILLEAKEKKLIRHIGLSNTTINELQKALRHCPISAIQNEFNVWHSSDRDDLFSFCQENRVSYLSYGCMAQGTLCMKEKQLPHFEKEDFRSHSKWWRKSWHDKQKKISSLVEKLEDSSFNRSLSQWAIGFNKAHPNILSSVISTQNPKHLEEFFSVPPLSSDELDFYTKCLS